MAGAQSRTAPQHWAQRLSRAESHSVLEVPSTVHSTSLLPLPRIGQLIESHAHQPELVALAKDTELLTAIWRAATVTPLTPARSSSLNEGRKKLVNAGAAESSLPLPDWWRQVHDALAVQWVAPAEPNQAPTTPPSAGDSAPP